MIRVTVEFFGPGQDLAQVEAISLELGDSSKLGAVRTALGERFPKLRTMGRSLRLAVNEQFADDARVLVHGDVIAVIPPVSGG